MPGNSSIYYNQVNSLNADLSYWIDYIQTNATVITQFNDTVDNLQTQINDLTTTIDALNAKLTWLEASVGKLTPYVQLSNNQVTVECGLPNMWEAADEFKHATYLSSYTNQNRVYVYCNKTIPNLYVDGYPVCSVDEVEDVSYFYSFNGSEQGIRHKITFGSIGKLSNTFLVFSDDNSYTDTVDSSTYKKVNVNMHMAPISKNTIVTPSTLRDSMTGKAISTIQPNTNINVNTQRAAANARSKVKK